MTPRNIRKPALIALLAAIATATAFHASAQTTAPAPAAPAPVATSATTPPRPSPAPATSSIMLTPPVVQPEAPAVPALLPSGDPNERVSIDWPSMPLSLAIPEIEKLTGRTILRSAALANVQDLTLKFATPPTRAEALQAIESLFTINQLALVPLGEKFLKLVPLNTVRLEAPTFIEGSTLSLPPSGRIATKLFQLQFLRAQDFLGTLGTTLNDQIRTFQLFQSANALLITDSITTLQRIEMVLKQVDRPAATPVQAKFYTLEFARASDLVNKLRTIIQGSPALGQQFGASISFNADDRTNQIFIIADPRQIPFFDELLKKLDVKADPNTRNEVIRLRTAQAQDVANILGQIINGQIRAAQAAAAGAGAAQRPTGGGAFAGQAGAAQNRNIGGGAGGTVNRGGGNTQGGANRVGGTVQAGGNRAGGNTATGGGAGGNRGTTQQVGGGGGGGFNRGGGATTTQFGGGGQGGAARATGISASSLGLDIGDQFSSYLTVFPDQRTNSIVVSGTVDDIRIIKELIEKLDMLLSQVRIEVVIAEVSFTDAAQTGIDSLGLQVDGNKLVGFNGGGAGIGIGGSMGGGGGVTGLATISRLASGYSLFGFIGLVSTPRKNNNITYTTQTLTTMHNTPANFFFGETRPVITSRTMNDTSGSTTSNVTAQQIGTRINVTPLIGYDGTVQLTLTQEISDVIGTVLVDQNTQYIIGLRNTNSTIVVKSGDIIVLGGIQKNSSMKSSNRLGPIPVIGDLLGSRSRSKTRNELIFFLRPVVLTNTEADNAPAYQQLDGMDAIKDDVRRVLGKAPAHPLETPATPAAQKKK